MTKTRKTRMLFFMLVVCDCGGDHHARGWSQRRGSSVRRCLRFVNPSGDAALEGFQILPMIWLMVSILCMARGSECQQSDSFTLSDLISKGSAIVSRFLNPTPSGSAFYKVKEPQVWQNGGGGRKNEFILLLLRLLGVDARKINDFAFDGIISLLQLMSGVFLKDGEKSRKGRRMPRDLPSFQYILGQPQVVDLLKIMQDPNLIDLLLKESEEKVKHLPEENVDCIHLLICKTKPFVRGMQRSLRFFMKRENMTGEEETCREKAEEGTCRKGDEDGRWEKASLEGRMFFFVPSLREVIEDGDKCDLLFPNCFY